MSGEQQRAPYPYAEDYELTTPAIEPESAMPLLTPFQRYVVESLNGLKAAQGEFTAEVAAMKAKLDEIAPHVTSLKNDAALAKKVLTYAKFIAFGLATRYFPEFAAGVAKNAPAILEAAGKAAGQ